MNYSTLSGSRTEASPGDLRAIRTIKLFIALGFGAESAFLALALLMFPDHGPLLWRAVWTLGLCGIGMGAAAGGLTSLLASRTRVGSPAAYLATALGGMVFYSICQTLCWGIDHQLGLNYWGSVDWPTLFLVKGYAAAISGGILGSVLLNSRWGGRLLDRTIG